jgi:hypothetical protein
MSFSLLFSFSKNDVGKQLNEYRQLKWLGFNREE